MVPSVSGRGATPRLLYVVTEDWYFLSHRLPMARAAKAAGFEVHVATNIGSGGAAIEREGFHLHAIAFARGKLSPLDTLRTVLALRRLYRDIAPDLVHHVALQPTVLGGLACPATTPSVNALTGLGHIFTSATAKARAVRAILVPLLRHLLGRAASVVLVQNPDDRATLVKLGVAAGNIVLVPGSGVDVARLQPLPEPAGPMTIAFVGRLIDIKGIRTLVAAHRLLRARGPAPQLLIAGTPDAANPGAIPQAEIDAWASEDGIAWLGHVDDIAAVWRQAHIAVQPSRGGEGVPKSLLEAAACGRPMVASDVPGCREIAGDWTTGFLVPPDEPDALADAIAVLAGAPDLRARFGREARRLAVERFSDRAVGDAVVALYRRLARRTPDTALTAATGGSP